MTAAVWAADNVTPLDVRLGLWETKSTSQMSGAPPIPESMLRSLSPEQRTKMEAMAKAFGQGVVGSLEPERRFRAMPVTVERRALAKPQ